MLPKKEKLEFPPQKAYFVAGLILVNKKGEILLVKERRSKNWFPPGGEVDYRNREQFLDTCYRETLEEVGIKLQKKPELLDLTISYPEGDNPYKDQGILLVIGTFISGFSEGQKIKLVRSSDPIERKYDVKEYLWTKPEDIIKKQIKVPKYFIERVIPKIDSWLEKHGRNKRVANLF